MATDTDSIILTISADTKQIQRAMQRLQSDTSRALQQMQGQFGNVDRAAAKTSSTITAANQNIQRSMRSTNQQAANLSFQLNDISQGLLSGTSPFTLMAQQGGQVVQVINQIRATGGGMGAAISGALGSMLNWTTLITFGLIAAAGAAAKFFTETDDGSEEAAKAAEEHAKAIKQIAEEYKAAIPAFAEFADARDRALQLGTGQEKLKAEIKSLGEELRDSFVSADFNKEIQRAIRLVRKEGRIGGGLEIDPKAQADITALEKAWKGLDDAMTSGVGIQEAFNQLREEAVRIDEKYNLAEKDSALLTVLKEINTTYHDRIKELEATGTASQKLNTLTAEQIKQQEEYNKAMKELQQIVDGPLTEAEKILKLHKLAIDNATGSMRQYVNAMGMANIAMANLATEGATALGESFTSGLDDFAKKVASVESGGSATAKNPRSSASGLFQFIDSTFVAMVRKLPGFENAAEDVILAQKDSVELQKRAFDQLVKDNSAALTRAGIPVTDATRYLAHFLGSQGAIDIISGKRGPSQSEIAANPFLAGMSGQDVVRWAEKKMGGARATVATQDARDKVKADREDAEIQGKITEAYDAQAAATAEELKYVELIRDLKKQAAEEGRGVSVEEMENAREIARLHGETVGREEGTKQAEAASKSYEGRLQALNDQTAALQLEAEQLGITALAQDQETVAREASIEALNIENELRRQGLEITAAQSAQILQSATAHQNAKVAIEEYNKTAKDTARATEEFAQQVGGIAKSAIGGFIADLRAGKSAGEAFNNMLNRIIDSLIDMALEAAFSAENMKALFSGMGGGGGGGGGGGLLGWIGNLFGFGGAGVAEKGGIVGSKLMPLHPGNPRHFIGAKSYALGGFPGKPPGSIPIYAHPGEMIIPKNMVNAAARPGSVNAIGNETSISNQLGPVTIDMAGTGTVAAGTQQAKQFGENVRALIAMELVRESRPGGLLRPGSGSAVTR